MSTILKALRRLEEERSVQEQRPLREEVTRGAASAKSRRVGRPLLAALLGLGVAAGAGAVVFWVLGRTPEAARPSELAVAGSAEPRGKPAAPAEQPRMAKRPAPRSSPSPAAVPSAASERELSAAALASPVEIVKRPPAQPRIAASEPAEASVSARTSSRPARPLDPAEIPGRHKHPGLRSSSSPSEPAPSIPLRTETPEPTRRAPAPAVADKPARSRVASGGPVQEASRPTAASREMEPRAEQPREAASEPPAASEVTSAPDAEGGAAGAQPEPAYAQAAPEESSKQPAESGAVAAREREPASAGSREIERAEIPGLRVERIVWHPVADRRVALIEFGQAAERREIREGDAVGPLVVSKIEPSGVVFIHEGVEVRRRIGE